MLVNTAPGRPALMVEPGDEIEVEVPPPRPARPQAEHIALEVAYQDQDLLVVNKPAGMVVHPAAGHWEGTLVNALLGLGDAWSGVGGEVRPGIVHRLDKGTSGLLVVARSDQAHRALAEQLASRTLHRTYLALVEGRVREEAAVLEGDIGRDPAHRQRMAVVSQGRTARTRYEVEERLPARTLLRLELDTGRTHQIRVHLAALGHPVSGDRQYGRPARGGPERPLLHAWRLAFKQPTTGEPIAVEAPVPEDFEKWLERWR